MQKQPIRLRDYQNAEFSRGRSRLIELIWLIVQALFVSSWVPGVSHRRVLLRLFGAKVGAGVGLKPYLKVKFPWKLIIGDHSWIGENVWIDNLERVTVGSNCCVSQGAYLCTGSHNWATDTFALITSPITIEDGVWISAFSIVGPGVRAATGSVLLMGSVATKSLEEWTIYQGNPAVKRRPRTITPR